MQYLILLYFFQTNMFQTMLGLLCTNPFKSPHSLSEVHHFSVVSWIHPKLKKLIGSVRNKIKSSFSYQQCLFFFNFILFNFTILYWFCHISKWICHRYTCIPHPELSSLLSPHTIPLGRPSAPASSIQYPALNLDWRLVSYMILYIFQCHSPKSSHPLPLPQSPKDCSIHQCF